jgi:hypothetical protein
MLCMCMGVRRSTAGGLQLEMNPQHAELQCM